MQQNNWVGGWIAPEEARVQIQSQLWKLTLGEYLSEQQNSYFFIHMPSPPPIRQYSRAYGGLQSVVRHYFLDLQEIQNKCPTTYWLYGSKFLHWKGIQTIFSIILVGKLRISWTKTSNLLPSFGDAMWKISFHNQSLVTDCSHVQNYYEMIEWSTFLKWCPVHSQTESSLEILAVK